MRRLVYLVGGQETTSYAKAREIQPSGQLKMRLDTIEEKAPQMSPIRKAMIEQFGYVSPKLRDKVVLN